MSLPEPSTPSQTPARVLAWVAELETPPDDAAPAQLALASMAALLRPMLRELMDELPPEVVNAALLQAARQAAATIDVPGGGRAVVVALPAGAVDEPESEQRIVAAVSRAWEAWELPGQRPVLDAGPDPLD